MSNSDPNPSGSNDVGNAADSLNAARNASSLLTTQIRQTQTALRNLNQQAARIEAFSKVRSALSATGQQLKVAQQRTRDLASAMNSSRNPTQAQIRAWESARDSVERLKQQHASLNATMSAQRQQLNQSGIRTNSLRQLAAEQRRARSAIDATTETLRTQNREKVRAGLNVTRLRFAAGRDVAGKVSAAGSAGLNVASRGVAAGITLLRSGYDQSTKHSELQAQLGLAGNAPELAQLQRQASRPEAGLNAKPDDIVSAQLALAQAGANASSVLAQTPTVVKMSQAYGKTFEESAGLLGGMANAFGLADDQVGHIADVLTVAKTEGGASLDTLADGLTRIGPLASNAGLSLEQTIAMLSTLGKASGNGQSAAEGGTALLDRLQNMDNGALNALSTLGVSTRDDKGQSRPLFALLKDIQASFEERNVSASQRTAYTNAIFGAGGAQSGTALMQATASGTLDASASNMAKSDGKIDHYLATLQNNLGGDLAKFQASFDGLSVDIFSQQEGALRGLVQTATLFLNKLRQWIAENKNIVQTIGTIAGAVIGVIGILGAIGMVVGPVIMGISSIIGAASLIGVAFQMVSGVVMVALGGLAWPIVAIVAIVGAIIAGALLIRKFWEPISAFFAGVVEGIGASFAPVGESFSPLIDALKGVWQWFTNLLEPIQFSKEALDTCRNAGVLFGKTLAIALQPATAVVNILCKGLDLLKEKLGRSKGDAAKIEKELAAGVASDDVAFSQTLGPTPSFDGIAYQPTLPAGGRSFIDNSTQAFNITVNNSDTNNQNFEQRIKNVMNEYNRENLAQKRSSLAYS